MNLEDEEEENNQKYSDEHKNWPELMQRLKELWGSNIESMMESSLKIMATLFSFVSDEFKNFKNDLYAIFKSGMESESLDIKLASIEALSSWVSIIDYKTCKQYEDLVPLIMNTTLIVLDKSEDKGVDCLSSIVDLVESEPKFFKKNFDYLFQSMKKICSAKDLSVDGIKQMAIQIIVSMIERLPTIFKENHNLIKDFLEMTFAYMIESTEDVTPEWINPKEGFLEDILDDSDNAGVKFSCHIIDRLICWVGVNPTLVILSTMVQTMMGSPNWRFKFAALMALSQVGEYVGELEELGPIVALVIKFLNDDHPKIRFAACHVIGQLSDDCEPHFQSKYHQDVIPALLGKLNDEAPRVLSHALAALTNFLEGMPKDYVKEYLELVLNELFPFTQKGISIVRENALSAIAAAAEAAGPFYAPYFDKTVPIIYNVLKTHTQPEYKQLRGQCIECITLMGYSAGKEQFKKYAQDIIEILAEIQKNDISSDSLDPQRCYLLSGWQRICMIMEEDFVPYLELVLPNLFKIVEQVLTTKATKKEAEEESQFSLADKRKKPIDHIRESSKKNNNTFEYEEVDIAITMIRVFITELNKHYINYLKPTMDLVLRALVYPMSDKIRKTAAICLPGLLLVVKNSNHPNKQELKLTLGQAYLATLWLTVEKESDAETILKFVHAIKDCISILGKFMPEDEIKDTSLRILKLLSDSDLRKLENENYKKVEDCEKEEIEILNDDNDQEEELHVGIAELIGMLFKTHKELTLPLVETLFTHVLSKVLQPGLSDKMHKFGLCLIDDMIEYLGIELIPNQWPLISEALLKYVTDKTWFVRQAAAYGIGILALKGKELFTDIAQICLVKLFEALAIPKTNEKDFHYGFTKDNIVAAIGKIIQSIGMKLDVSELIPKWVDQLPIKYDIVEGKKQHEFMLDIILKWNAALVLGPNGEKLPKIVTLYVTIIDTKMSNDNIAKKFAQFLKALIAEDNTREILQNACKPLPDLQKKKIEKLLSMDTNTK
eukprot:CAMPEP_0176443770 /NCGR_PEP_ID=MMETSP0127-20121128/22638_1 /TAXON_ID=938130 /ORGANISM="Platyophrya macrostoma, Strain WH" /LENGTH=1003 /DNA_ID=CAMNT_0017829097 /DNA_START=385 /DNA_END=3396 /DNA_ORIENTATION=+